jgi:hypothetical protein
MPGNHDYAKYAQYDLEKFLKVKVDFLLGISPAFEY